MAYDNDLLKFLINLTGRLVFSEEKIIEIITKGGGRGKQLKAYNLCDGTRSQSEIAKEIGIDQGNFSRSLNRWISAGIVARVGEGDDTKIFHVYPINE